jgi:hypothetical protein
MFGGVGLDLYLEYADKDVVMDRADIDDYRITSTPKRLIPYFDSADI